MSTAQFHVNEVAIEGFRAFTHEQTVAINGGHVFLFGNNGCGKSSIVEAIRWCLFGGSSEGSEAGFRNAFYTKGDCRVELALNGPGGIWRVVRRLRPGSGKSDQVIRDPLGKTLLQADVFPNLTGLGPREGTHIIFAAQQISHRRPQPDIADFDKILYAYLRVEEIPDLLKRLSEIAEEQEAATKQLAEEISAIEEHMRNRIQEVTIERDAILRNPPWEGNVPPTRAETDAKIRRFVEELSRLASTSAPAESTVDNLLTHAENWAARLASAAGVRLQSELMQLRSKGVNLRVQWQSFQGIQSAIADLQKTKVTLDVEVSRSLAGRSLADLEKDLNELSDQMEGTTARLKVVSEAKTYCDEYAVNECPVCSSSISSSELSQRLTSSLGKTAPEQERFLN